jgi:hypothetical protein
MNNINTDRQNTVETDCGVKVTSNDTAFMNSFLKLIPFDWFLTENMSVVFVKTYILSH